jgi:hypothetical protein
MARSDVGSLGTDLIPSGPLLAATDTSRYSSQLSRHANPAPTLVLRGTLRPSCDSPGNASLGQAVEFSMPSKCTRRYSIEIKSVEDGTVLFTAADWNDEEHRIALAQIMGLESRAFDSTTRLYWIDVKDEQGVRQLLTTADWNDDDRRIAIGQIFRLAGVPDDNCFTELLLGLR